MARRRYEITAQLPDGSEDVGPYLFADRESAILAAREWQDATGQPVCVRRHFGPLHEDGDPDFGAEGHRETIIFSRGAWA